MNSVAACQCLAYELIRMRLSLCLSLLTSLTQSRNHSNSHLNKLRHTQPSLSLAHIPVRAVQCTKKNEFFTHVRSTRHSCQRFWLLGCTRVIVQGTRRLEKGSVAGHLQGEHGGEANHGGTAVEELGSGGEWADGLALLAEESGHLGSQTEGTTG